MPNAFLLWVVVGQSEVPTVITKVILDRRLGEWVCCNPIACENTGIPMLLEFQIGKKSCVEHVFHMGSLPGALSPTNDTFTSSKFNGWQNWPARLVLARRRGSSEAF